MVGKYIAPEMITPEEAVSLFRHASASEMYRVKALYDTYRQHGGMNDGTPWGTMSLLTFIYDTGRVQGIREERARRKS